MLNFYLYSISAISLSIFYFALLVAVGGALRLFSGTSPLDQLAAQETLAKGAGFALLGLPLWWLHWRWLRDQFSKASGHAVTWHRFYLFTIVCLSAIVMLLAGGAGFSGLLELILGSSGFAELENTGVYLTALALSSILWLHHWRQFKGGLGELNPLPSSAQEPAAS